jgi:hypothetical protein
MDNETDQIATLSLETPTTRTVKFVVFLLLDIPSVLCSLFIFFYFLREQQLRRWQNHAFASLTICNFLITTIEVPLTLTYFRTGRVCFYWIFANYTLSGFSLYLMAVASLERYILIFWSRQLHRTALRRRLVHYIPLVVPMAFVTIWYTALLVLRPCSTNTGFDYTSFVCGGACYQSNRVWATVDWILTSLIPVFLIICLNSLLLGQVVLEKRHVRQALTWRKTRKMVIQLSATVFLYLVTQIPVAIISVISQFGPMSDGLSYFTLVWLYYLPYCIYLLSPFAYVLTTKECHRYLRRAQHANMIGPTNHVQTNV